MPIHQVRDALGHANIQMTSTYLRTRTDSLDAAYAQLDRGKLKLVVNKWNQGVVGDQLSLLPMYQAEPSTYLSASTESSTVSAVLGGITPGIPGAP